MGLSTEAVRQRVRRGQLAAEKVDGRVLIILPQESCEQEPEQTTSEPVGASSAFGHGLNGDQTEEAADRTDGPDRPNRRLNGRQTTPEPASEPRFEAVYRELIDTLKQENARLWHELEVRDEEIHRRDVIIRDALERPLQLVAGEQVRAPERRSEAPASSEQVSERPSEHAWQRFWAWLRG